MNRLAIIAVLLTTQFVVSACAKADPTRTAKANSDPNVPADWEPIALEIPKWRLRTVGSPPPGLRLRKPTGKPRPPFFAPRGTKNIALGKPVTSSAPPKAMKGALRQITDGEKGSDEKNVVEVPAGAQWVQIDLGATAELHAVVVWHDHSGPVVVRSIVIQLSDDPKFETGVTTVFNNDWVNLLKLGEGKEFEYIETNEGLLVECGGKRARYVRLYSRGSTAADENPYVEVEVYGIPAPTPQTQQTEAPKRANKGPVGEDWVPIRQRRPLPYEVRMAAPKLPEGVVYRKPLPFFVPREVKNLAKGKPVSASVKPFVGELSQLTDGDVHATDGSIVVLERGLQWVQVDLQHVTRVRAVRVWHMFADYRHYRQVVIQVSDDPTFKDGVRTLFNNSGEKTDGFEAGPDARYVEIQEGATFDGEGTPARYVRLYSNGSNLNTENEYIEVEVWGEPVER